MDKSEINARLIALYAEISGHTQIPCSGQGDHPCKIPHSCCDPSICEMMIEQAKWDWDVGLPRTAHPKYPLMAPDGTYTAPPHMRPLCAVHCCVIQAWGENPEDPVWTTRYWELRDEINELETLKHRGIGIVPA